jgi:hypothetical protein
LPPTASGETDPGKADISPYGRKSRNFLFGLHGLGLLFPEKEADYRPLARQTLPPTLPAFGRGR